MRIAIIGSGIAGLAAAYRLSLQSDVHVTLIEREGRIGMAAQTIDCQPLPAESHETENNHASHNAGQPLIGDVPSRMFNAAQWPQLFALYQQAEIESVSVNATQSFSQYGDDGVDHTTYLHLNNAMRPKLGAQLFHSLSRGIIAEASRFRKQGLQDLKDGLTADETLATYLQQRQFSDAFRWQFLYPTLSSTVCTCSFESLDRYPAAIILSALERITRRMPLLRLKHSALDVANRLTTRVAEVRLNGRVERIVETESGVEVWMDGTQAEVFDRVIVATQADTAARLSCQMADPIRQDLAAIRYEEVRVVVHRDRSLMPTDRKHWATFNMHCDAAGGDRNSQRATCTVWMNQFHDDWTTAADVFQTINPIRPPQHVVQEIALQRSVVTASSQAAIRRIQEFQRLSQPRVLLAGSWADTGIPLLETGVSSAWSVCDLIEKNKLVSSVYE